MSKKTKTTETLTMEFSEDNAAEVTEKTRSYVITCCYGIMMLYDTYFKVLFQTHIKHKNYSKTCSITPNRSKAIASLSRRNYKAAATGITKIQQTGSYIVAEVAKSMKTEMKSICS